MWVLSRNWKALNASCKSRRVQREGRAGAEGTAGLCPLPTWLFCAQPFISSAHGLSPPQTLLPGNFTGNTPAASSPAAHRDLPGCAMEAGGGGGGRVDLLPEQEALQHPHPIFGSRRRALPCSRSALPAVGLAGERQPAPSNKLRRKQTLPMQD